MIRVVRSCGLLLALGLSFVVGCEDARRDPSVLSLVYGQDPDTLNPLTASDTTSLEFQRYVCEELARRDLANPDQFQPLLAERWEFDADTNTYTIHIRKGVKWHPATLPNGRKLPAAEVTAHDVKFTFDVLLNPNVEAASKRSYYEDPDAKEASERIKIDVQLVDDYTLTIRWKKPYFLSEDFSLDIIILPKHIFSVDENGEPISLDVGSNEFAQGFNNHWANTRLYGTGPMVFDEWRREEGISFRRNADYWGQPFHFERVVFQCITNQNTVYQKLLQNELDFAMIVEKDRFVQGQSHPSVLEGKLKLDEFEYPAYRYIGYNFKHPFLAERNVRWALSHAVPVDTIIEHVFKGLARRVTGPFVPGSPANDAAIEPIAYDLDAARKLLTEAGWTDTNGDGVRDKLIDGRRIDASFELNTFADSLTFKTIAELFKENCRRIGVNVKITQQKWALMLESLDKKRFDATMLGWATDWKSDPFQVFHGSQADVPESSNYGGYRNPQLDKLIVELRETLDPDKQVELYHQIHRLIYEDQPYTFLFAELRTAGQDPRVQNVEFYKIRPCYDTHRWYVEN